MPSNGHIDALLGNAWAWDDDDDDEHDPRTGAAAREHERNVGPSTH